MRDIEEQLAHLTKMVEDLSDVVARQQTEIARQGKRIEMLMAREAEREASAGAAVFGDERPPHY